mmetsp:Transcript_36388/g.53384  ORF Transcript_36388/g.53384 Transcript_36388/m.53384 type:complete len:94 (-) Transcript_36388:84-365(-)
MWALLQVGAVKSGAQKQKLRATAADRRLKSFLIDAIMKTRQEKILKRRGLTARANDRDFEIVEANSCASDVRLPVVYQYVIQFEFQYDLCLLL